ncbi:MAG: DUF3786 domain-containing protein [Desulfobacteraceae bacterium]|nr:DUF3786 domain-containing protein [Desulfobacteraceae bacterium]
MPDFKNVMEVFKLLEKTNCKKCNEPTCLAFASKVFLGTKTLDLCPALSPTILNNCTNDQNRESKIEEEEKSILALKHKIKSCNLKQAAKRVGGVFSNQTLTINIFGKPFSIASNGELSSDIHIKPFIVAPVLEYVLQCKGIPLTGKWIPFRELKGGSQMNSLFVQRSEKPLKHLADTYTDLFEDLIELFNGQKVENHHDSDISLALTPLPNLPLLICYWKPEDEMASELHLFFDSSADMNAGLYIAYGITAGIVNMFEKLFIKHGGR